MDASDVARRNGESGEAWAARMQDIVARDLAAVDGFVYALRTGELVPGAPGAPVSEYQVRAQLTRAIDVLERLRSPEWIGLTANTVNRAAERTRRAAERAKR